MFKGAFIHHIAIDPKLSIYIIEVVYGLFVWIHEVRLRPIKVTALDGFIWNFVATSKNI